MSLFQLIASFWSSLRGPRSVHGIPNFAHVSGDVWRGGQPNEEGWAYLKSLGVTTVVKLNSARESRDDGAEALGMTIVDCAIQPEDDQNLVDDIEGTLRRPDPAMISRALDTITASQNVSFFPDPSKPERLDGEFKTQGRVFVHCSHGEDRTGLVIGMFRVRFCGWTKEAAYQEMRRMHFHPELLGLHETWEAFPPT